MAWRRSKSINSGFLDKLTLTIYLLHIFAVMKVEHITGCFWHDGTFDTQWNKTSSPATKSHKTLTAFCWLLILTDPPLWKAYFTLVHMSCIYSFLLTYSKDILAHFNNLLEVYLLDTSSKRFCWMYWNWERNITNRPIAT